MKHFFGYDLKAQSALSLSMPIRLESYGYDGLHPFFQMNMPEGALRDAIDRVIAKPFGSDYLTVLALLDNNQIGSVRYTLEGKALANDDKVNLDLEDLLESNDALLFTELLNRFAMRSGVAGIQPKVLLDIQRKEFDKSTYPIDSYIVKSWGDEYPELANNEFFCLIMEKEAALTVYPFYLSGNGKLLITKRFDISESGIPLDFEDFCVLQGKSTQQKYDASLESCANAITQCVSTEYRQTALYDFFKLTVLNIYLRNGDAHLKNYGVLYKDLQQYSLGSHPKSKVTFSPVFDIISTTPYIKNDTMALSLTGSKRRPKWKVLVRFAKQHCMLSNKQISQICSEIDAAKTTCLPLLAELTNKHPGFRCIADELTQLLSADIYS
ncbi:MAG TPA: type II toxin-antitoxin system HipA family toxin [Psychromonas hadalis]|nr:type II toxin-antitoxin system HipA family toxin [Psychromonas hadalis]